MSSNPNMERAARAWGKDMPDWIEALASACDREGSQGAVGKKIGVSSSAVNQALGRTNAALRLDRLEARVRGELMKETVSCPVLGEISKRDCLDHQGRRFRAINRLRVQLHQACQTCPNREAECAPKK